MKKILVLLGGIPGSGKTTLAELFDKLLNSHVDTFSTDEFFTDENGTYTFNGNKIKDAHEWNASRTEQAMICSPAEVNKTVTHVVIVHNTFAELWETDQYKQLAEAHGFFLINLICRRLHDGKSSHVDDQDIVDRCSEKIARSFAPWLAPVKTRKKQATTSVL